MAVLCVCLWISLIKNQIDQIKPDNSKFLHSDSSFCQILAYFFPFKNCRIYSPLVHTMFILRQVYYFTEDTVSGYQNTWDIEIKSKGCALKYWHNAHGRSETVHMKVAKTGDMQQDL